MNQAMIINDIKGVDMPLNIKQNHANSSNFEQQGMFIMLNKLTDTNESNFSIN